MAKVTCQINVYMKRLIKCNTYYQLILAIHMKQQLFRADEVDIWISDHSLNAKNVASRLAETKLFSSVEYVENKQYIYNRNKFLQGLDVLLYSLGIESAEFPLYDEIIFCGIELDCFLIDDYYRLRGHNTKWSLYEEGVLSYNSTLAMGNRSKLVNKVRTKLGKGDFTLKIENFYCSFPEIQEGLPIYNVRRIPLIDKNSEELVEVLNYVFDYKAEPITQRYIYFASSSDIDGVSFGETEFVIRLANMLGKNELIVKMHPRDSRNVYQTEGITIMANSYVPWEVIQLNQNVKNIVLLTTTSGSFLNISAMQEMGVEGHFLTKYYKNSNSFLEERMKEIEKIITLFHSHGICKGIDMNFNSLVR